MSTQAIQTGEAFVNLNDYQKPSGRALKAGCVWKKGRRRYLSNVWRTQVPGVLPVAAGSHDFRRKRFVMVY